MKNIIRRITSLMAVLIMVMSCMTVSATELSDDNSLSSLGLHNGTIVGREFSYDVWNYDVEVEPGTTELFLEPTTSHPNAEITSILGTVLVDGKATVLINLKSESGTPMTYTLNVTEKGAGATETEAPETEEVTEEPQTEEMTETPTEPVTEPQNDEEKEEMRNEVTVLTAQINELKEKADLAMKIMYGLIAFAVILLFIIINLILKNRDLKDDLKDAEDKVAYQTNEFARKEKMMATDHYYAPVQQGGQPMQNEPVQEVPKQVEAAPKVEEVFGSTPEETQTQTSQKEESDIDVTMVDL